MFQKVLAAVEKREASDPTLATALEISKQSNGRLFIMHILEATYLHDCGPEETVRDTITGEAVAPTHEYKETIRQEIDRKYADVLKPFANYEIIVTDGRPGTEIRRWARKIGADLIVLGPHKERLEEESALTGAPRGNTVDDIIAHVTSPVMIVNSASEKGGTDFRDILVAVDFSRSCEYASQFAARMAQRYGSNLFLFHVTSEESAGVTTGASGSISALKERLIEFCKVPAGIKYQAVVWEGIQPSSEILKIADEKKISLVVMGSHTREISGGSYMGSAVDQVGARCMCPVVVVTHPDAIAKA